MTSPKPVPAVSAGPAIQLAIAMAIAGTIGLFVKESGVGALNAVFWRCAFGFLVMLAWCAWRVGLRGHWPGRRDALLIGIGGVCIVANWVLVFAALDYISITLMSIVYHVQPFFVLGMVWVAYGERTSLRNLAWVVLAFAGLVLAIGFDPGMDADLRTLAIGVALTIAAAFFYGAAVVAAKGIRATRPEIVTLAHTVIGLALVAPLAHPNLAVMHNAATAGWLVGLGVLHTGVVYVLMYGAYPRLTGAAIAVLTFANPVSAILLDALVYGTTVTLGQIVGLVVIAVATLAVRRG